MVSAVGAPETDVFNIDGPKQIDGLGSIRLVEVAEELGVNQFVMVTSLGTGKFGWPAGALNLFWGILSWKRKAEEALEKSGMAYTIIRPGECAMFIQCVHAALCMPTMNSFVEYRK